MRRLLALVATTLLALRPAVATDPYAFFDWDVSYVTAAPLGVKQQASKHSFSSSTFSSPENVVRC